MIMWRIRSGLDIMSWTSGFSMIWDSISGLDMSCLCICCCSSMKLAEPRPRLPSPRMPPKPAVGGAGRGQHYGPLQEPTLHLSRATRWVPSYCSHLSPNGSHSPGPNTLPGESVAADTEPSPDWAGRKHWRRPTKTPRLPTWLLYLGTHLPPYSCGLLLFPSRASYKSSPISPSSPHAEPCSLPPRSPHGLLCSSPASTPTIRLGSCCDN